jgi:hypothetical protein
LLFRNKSFSPHIISIDTKRDNFSFFLTLFGEGLKKPSKNVITTFRVALTIKKGWDFTLPILQSKNSSLPDLDTGIVISFVSVPVKDIPVLSG